MTDTPPSGQTIPEPCTCIEKFNTRFADQNQRMTTTTWTNVKTGEQRTTVAVPVKKIVTKKRTQLMRLIPNYCPMCGQRYVPKEAAS